MNVEMLTELGIKPKENMNEEPTVLRTNVRQKLSRIKRPGTQMVLWQREPAKNFQLWLEKLDFECLPHIRLLIKPKNFVSTVHSLLDDCGMPDDEMRSYFVNDIYKLVLLFSDIIKRAHVDVRFEKVDHDSCWKFHRDSVDTRLVTTYRGAATEWVKTQYSGEALQSQKEYQGPIEHFRPHDVGIFKGSRNGLGSGIVHRSPPISGKTKTRLILCLNEKITLN